MAPSLELGVILAVQDKKIRKNLHSKSPDRHVYCQPNHFQLTNQKHHINILIHLPKKFCQNCKYFRNWGFVFLFNISIYRPIFLSSKLKHRLHKNLYERVYKYTFFINIVFQTRYLCHYHDLSLQSLKSVNV